MTVQQETPTMEVQASPPPAERADGPKAMVSHLYALSDRNTGARNQMLALRSSLGRREGYSSEAVPVVGRFLPEWSLAEGEARTARRNDTVRRGYYLTAGLFAFWHVNRTSSPAQDRADLGGALATLSQRKKKLSEVLIGDLTRTTRAQCANTLLKIVTALATEGIATNWYELAFALATADERAWKTNQRKWAETYYRHCKH